MSTSPNIEKLFMEYMKVMGETPGGFIGILDPEHIKKGDPKTLGKEMARGADIIENTIKDMDFQPWEYEKGKTASRLIEAVKIYRKMGEEIETMTHQEPKEYHLYVITILIDIISSLINHIESE
jgi:hypothetical protein